MSVNKLTLDYSVEYIIYYINYVCTAMRIAEVVSLNSRELKI